MQGSDLKVQVNQEKALLRVELEGLWARGQGHVDRRKTQLEAEKEMIAQWRELYQSRAAKGSSTQY